MFKVTLLSLIAGLALSSTANAAPFTVRATIGGFVVQPNAGNPTLPQAFLMLSPEVSECPWNLLPVPLPESNLGRAMVSTALSAQAAGMEVDVTYDAANSCVVTRIVAVAH